MSRKDVFSHVNSYRVYRTNWRTSLYHTVRVKWWSAQSSNEETTCFWTRVQIPVQYVRFSPFYYMWLCVLPFTILHFTVYLVNQQLKSSSCSPLEPESTTIHSCINQNNIWFNDSYFKERNHEINCFNHIFKTVIRFS